MSAAFSGRTRYDHATRLPPAAAAPWGCRGHRRSGLHARARRRSAEPPHPWRKKTDTGQEGDAARGSARPGQALRARPSPTLPRMGELSLSRQAQSVCHAWGIPKSTFLAILHQGSGIKSGHPRNETYPYKKALLRALQTDKKVVNRKSSKSDTKGLSTKSSKKLVSVCSAVRGDATVATFQKAFKRFCLGLRRFINGIVNNPKFYPAFVTLDSLGLK